MQTQSNGVVVRLQDKSKLVVPYSSARKILSFITENKDSLCAHGDTREIFKTLFKTPKLIKMSIHDTRNELALIQGHMDLGMPIEGYSDEMTLEDIYANVDAHLKLLESVLEKAEKYEKVRRIFGASKSLKNFIEH